MYRASLVIPCYNEGSNLRLLVGRCVEALSDQTIEVILVDNGSTDNTKNVLPELIEPHHFIRTVRVEHNQGYGFGIVSGLNAASADILAWTHADMQTDPADVLKGLALFDQAESPQNLFVKGQRYGRSFFDVLFTIGMFLFETLLFQKPFWDINAQPVIFHRTFFEQWIVPPHDFSLDLYALWQAKQKKLNIKRIQVHFGARAHGQSHWNVDWRSKYQFIIRTMRYSFQLRQGKH